MPIGGSEKTRLRSAAIASPREIVEFVDDSRRIYDDVTSWSTGMRPLRRRLSAQTKLSAAPAGAHCAR
jgi:hypothetical protein